MEDIRSCKKGLPHTKQSCALATRLGANSQMSHRVLDNKHMILYRALGRPFALGCTGPT